MGWSRPNCWRTRATTDGSCKSTLPAIAAMMASPGIKRAMTKTSTTTIARMTSEWTSLIPMYLPISVPVSATHDRACCLCLALLEPKRMRPEPGFPVLQEVFVIPTLHHLAVSRCAFFPPEPSVLVGVVEGFLQLPIDGAAFFEIDLLTAGLDQRNRGVVLAAAKVEAAIGVIKSGRHQIGIIDVDPAALREI